MATKVRFYFDATSLLRFFFDIYFNGNGGLTTDEISLR
jgi:hypothetical protein